MIRWYVRWFDKKTGKLVEQNEVRSRAEARTLKRNVTDTHEKCLIVRAEYNLVKESVVR